ncbi:MAG: hypothetical protein P8N51_19330 [Pseudomonadales bacterium]|jgi:hypothetical protein|nr:hypothetical protein [Pseudomonadales bacterium]MDG1443289.1 hypothetical protein [Pseudomonadales bacterium]
MDAQLLIRWGLVFAVFVTTLSMNIGDNLIARVGVQESYLCILIVATACSALLAKRSLYLIATIAMFSLNANMPADFSLNFGFDRDYYAGVMLAMVLQPIVARTFH